MDQLLLTIKNALPILALIFILVIIAIFSVRLIINILINKAKRKYNILKKKAQKKISQKISSKYIKEEDELLLNKQNQNNIAKNSNQSYQIIKSQEQEEQREQLNNMDIVDIVKPIGFFTSMILGQKLTYLIQSAQIINKRGKKGFWVSMVEAQEKAAGRQHGRSR